MTKPFFAPLIEPVGLLWLLMALGVLWLCWSRQWRSAAWLGLPTLLIFLVGSTPLVEKVVGQAERPYAVTNFAALTPAEAVVALGGGYLPSSHDPLRFSFGEPADRVLAAVELVRLGKAHTLVLGGCVRSVAGKPSVPTISLLQDWVTSWRLAPGGVTNLGRCKDTHDEALEFKRLRDSQKWQKVILVTSALHMPRSVAVFKAQGITVTPLACDFQVHGVERNLPAFEVFPRQDRFVVLSLYLHEQFGWWLYKWRGWI
jgi:uncharacterized SAM-binding protein YcdF (DUF218 family)